MRKDNHSLGQWLSFDGEIGEIIKKAYTGDSATAVTFYFFGWMVGAGCSLYLLFPIHMYDIFHF